MSDTKQLDLLRAGCFLSDRSGLSSCTCGWGTACGAGGCGDVLPHLLSGVRWRRGSLWDEAVTPWVASVFAVRRGCFVSFPKEIRRDVESDRRAWGSAVWTAAGAARGFPDLGTCCSLRRPAGEPECGAGSACPAPPYKRALTAEGARQQLLLLRGVGAQSGHLWEEGLKQMVPKASCSQERGGGSWLQPESLCINLLPHPFSWISLSLGLN